MPKIPTFTTQARPTAEVGSVQSNIQAPIPTYLGTIQNTLSDYFVKEQALKDKTEATKEYLNLSLEFDTIQKGSIKNIDPSLATETFQNQYQFLAKQKINSMQNKGAAKLLKEKLDLDLITRSFQVTKGSRDQLNLEFTNTWNTAHQLNISKYILAEGSEKDIYRSEIIQDIKNKNLYLNEGEIKLEEDTKTTRSTLLSLDLNNLISKNKLAEAKAILTNLDVSKDLDSKTRGELLNKINKQEEIFAEKNFNENINQIAANSQFSNLGKISDIAIPSTGNTSTDYKNKTKVKSVIEKVQQTIDKDGSAEFYTNNDINLYQLNSDFNQIYAGTMQNPTPENISLSADAFDKYAVEANKKYNELSVPQEKRTLLTAASIENLKQRIQGATGTEDKLKVINEVQLIYGKNIPSIMNQIKNKIGDSVAFSMSVTDPDLKKYSLEGVITDENKKNFSSKLKDTMVSPEVEISKTIRKQLESFSNIIANQPRSKVNAAAVIDPVVSNLTTAVMRRVIDGTESLSSSDVIKIAKDFTEKFSSDYDLTNDTYWIPRKIGNEFVNQLFFEARSEVFKTSLKYDQIDFSQIKIKPIGDGEKLLSQKETLEFFKKNGEFYLNSNDEVYFGVKDNDGVPRKFMYSTVSEKGKETYKPLTFKFLDNSVNVGGFYDLDMELIYNYMVIADPNISPEAMMP
jgi:hypothetical protein